MLTTFTKGTVEASLRDPLVNRLRADLEQCSELIDVKDGRKLHTDPVSVGERLLDLGLR